MIPAVIVGLGRWGRSFVTAMQGHGDRLRFVRAVDVAPHAAREFAASHGLPLGSDYAEVLADAGVRAVVLATPHSLHPDQVVAAARPGQPGVFGKPPPLQAPAAARVTRSRR